MKLFHGTSLRNLDKIKREGLKPRGSSKKGNWKHSVLSNPKAVYLTAAYSLYYAWCATKGNEPALILEIDTNRINPWRLSPDEDFLEQVSRHDPSFAEERKAIEATAGDNKRYALTVHFRDQLESKWVGTEAWSASVKHMGNCCYFGTIPTDAIKRYAIIPEPISWVRWSDPTISLENFYIMGEYYKALSAKLFGDDTGYEPEGEYGKLPPDEMLKKVFVHDMIAETTG